MYPVSGQNQFQNDAGSNIPNMSLAFTMYTTTFGNMTFQVQPATPGEVAGGFPSVPYLSLEALLYQQQASNPITAPLNVLSGGTAGVQNISGGQTMQGATGTQQYFQGYQAASPLAGGL